VKLAWGFWLWLSPCQGLSATVLLWGHLLPIIWAKIILIFVALISMETSRCSSISLMVLNIVTAKFSNMLMWTRLISLILLSWHLRRGLNHKIKVLLRHMISLSSQLVFAQCSSPLFGWRPLLSIDLIKLMLTSNIFNLLIIVQNYLVPRLLRSL